MEQRLGRHLLRAAANRFRRPTPAAQELQGVDEQRLAGSRLPGKYVQSPSRLDRKLFHDGQVLHLEVTDHPTAEV